MVLLGLLSLYILLVLVINSGIILCYGRIDSNTTYTFPMSFTSHRYVIGTHIGEDTAVIIVDYLPQVSISTVHLGNSKYSIVGKVSVNYIAIGY